eukprot:CAMPEP_0174258472 /NCGR_PEP_ID=MMETSP0439-20130205/7457_1 /TAXON_ID=0 /ORGANISM="Stereomyxa ramosa, Strain Chinc5" /LENGTH=377 /DNA_ID=CAMNT_0015341991 /DNA_START=214 /DNA_END=1347 /DNA_ORIENTATION=-
MRVATLPSGPTLTFQVKSYTLRSDIANLQRFRPTTIGYEYKYPPLVVLNNFGSNKKEVKLMSVVLRKIFPPLNIQTTKLADCKRVVLLDYKESTGIIRFRHYLITLNSVGISKSVKRVVQAQIPDLSNLRDISQYVLRGAKASESDQEDGPECRVNLEEKDLKGGDEAELRREFRRKQARVKRYKGNTSFSSISTSQTSLRLKEVGPRMNLELIKVTQGFCDGEVLFHKLVKKTPEEILEMRLKKEKQILLKKKRQQEQKENLKKKGKLVEDSDEEEDDDGSKEEEEDEDEYTYEHESIETMGGEDDEEDEEDEDEGEGDEAIETMGDSEDEDESEEMEEEVEQVTKPSSKKKAKKRKRKSFGPANKNTRKKRRNSA